MGKTSWKGSIKYVDEYVQSPGKLKETYEVGKEELKKGMWRVLEHTQQGSKKRDTRGSRVQFGTGVEDAEEEQEDRSTYENLTRKSKFVC